MPPPRKAHLAFTLSEVLITLGIIGVVAALTLPALISKYEKQVLENQFKTAYSLVNNAVTRMSADNPDIMNTYCGSTYHGSSSSEEMTKFAVDFSKYFDVVNDKTTIRNNILYNNINFKQPNYKKYSKGTDPNGYTDGQFAIKNGMTISNGYCWIGNSSKGLHVEFLIDTNGLKGPNAMGYDLFYFWINSDNKVVTCPQIPDNPAYCNFLTEDNTGAHNGVNCSTFALRNESPHDKTKKYWDTLP